MKVLFVIKSTSVLESLQIWISITNSLIVLRSQSLVSCKRRWNSRLYYKTSLATIRIIELLLILLLLLLSKKILIDIMDALWVFKLFSLNGLHCLKIT